MFGKSPKHKDVESAGEDNHDHLSGFPALTHVLTIDEDRFSMVFNRFDRLAARSLTHMQSELAYLEYLLLEMDEVDTTYVGEEEEEARRKDCLEDWGAFREAVKKKNETQIKRLRLIKEIQSKLKAYRKALLQQAALINLDNPTEKTRQAIMNEVTYGHGKRRGKRKGIPLYLPRGSALLYKDKEDLVSLKTPVFQDYVTSFVDKRMGKMFKAKEKGDDKIYLYPSSKLFRFVSVVCAVLAEIAMALPVWGLYAVGRYVPLRYAPWIQLTIMTFSSFLFVITLGLLFNVKRSDLFIATTAYFTVLVVFLGLNLHS